jgi:hypothetical protein
MIRINLKVVLLLLCAAVAIVTLSLWTRCGEVVLASRSRKNSGHTAEWDTGNKKVSDGQVFKEHTLCIVTRNWLLCVHSI